MTKTEKLLIEQLDFVNNGINYNWDQLQMSANGKSLPFIRMFTENITRDYAKHDLIKELLDGLK